MDSGKRYNFNPVSQAARSLFARMMEHIDMDIDKRNMIVCGTLSISDDDLAKMVEDANLRRIYQDEETVFIFPRNTPVQPVVEVRTQSGEWVRMRSDALADGHEWRPCPVHLDI